MNFGKYKGLEIEDVMEFDPSYIAWAASVGAVTVDEKVLKKAMMAWHDERCLSEAEFESEHGDWGDRN